MLCKSLFHEAHNIFFGEDGGGGGGGVFLGSEIPEGTVKCMCDKARFMLP